MRTQDFDFDLPQELIAQTPLLNRSDSRLLFLDRTTGQTQHHIFKDLPMFLKAGDVLVLNESKVLPARIYGTKEETNASVELLILEFSEHSIQAMVRNARVVKLGSILNFGEGRLRLECIEVCDQGIRIFKQLSKGLFLEALSHLGEMPLPPYIKEKLNDQNRYQTVYSKNLGSSAAPTAGLHFTPELLKEIEQLGVEIVRITLHVGLGTFKPVEVEDVLNHKMHSEHYQVTKEAATRLNQAKLEGRRIIAVGTTSVRTLETQMMLHGQFIEEISSTDIFIYPGKSFKAIDGLITNFHLPKSTLMMLVSAFAGKDAVMNAYQVAIHEKYRFFSFGDAMLIL